MPRFPLKAIALLAGIWLAVGIVIYFARRAHVTPATVETYVDQHPIEAQAPEKRGEVLEKLAKQLNQLTYEERREVRMSKKLDAVFRKLTPPEQSRFLDLTMPAGFKQMMEAFNKMEPARRKAFVAKTLEDMRRQGDTDAPVNDDPNVQKIVEAGLHSFYSDASAETKLDLAPVIEQMQKNLRGFH